MSIVPTENDVVLGLLSNVLPIRWLPQLVLAFRGATAMDRLALLSVEVATQPLGQVQMAMRKSMYPAPPWESWSWRGWCFEAFGRHLHNPRWLAWYLSGVYCHLLNKNRPTRLVWSSRQWEACKCADCGRDTYIRRDSDRTEYRKSLDPTARCEVVALPIWCTHCKPRAYRRYVDGKDRPDGVNVPKTTRAFRELQYQHPTELMQTACDLFEQLKANERACVRVLLASIRV